LGAKRKKTEDSVEDPNSTIGQDLVNGGKQFAGELTGSADFARSIQNFRNGNLVSGSTRLLLSGIKGTLFATGFGSVFSRMAGAFESAVGRVGSMIETEFSGAPLVQGELKASALLNGDLSTPIYRLAGGDAPLMGRSWTTVDPRSFSSLAEFKQAAGIGSWNTGETILIGQLKSFEGAVGRTALPIEGIPNPWLPEIRLNGPAEQMVHLLETISTAQ
jgi:hypothetical protein